MCSCVHLPQIDDDGFFVRGRALPCFIFAFGALAFEVDAALSAAKIVFAGVADGAAEKIFRHNGLLFLVLAGEAGVEPALLGSKPSVQVGIVADGSNLSDGFNRIRSVLNQSYVHGLFLLSRYCLYLRVYSYDFPNT